MHSGQGMRDLLIIGSGHYVTGHTNLDKNEATDKDFGIVLPSAFFLRSLGLINKITVCGTRGDKLAKIAHERLWPPEIKKLDTRFEYYPKDSVVDEKAYLQALDNCSDDCAVIIAVPDLIHAEIMIECAKREISFLIVKPAVSTLADFYKVRSHLKPSTLAMVDYHKIYDDANLILRADIEAGNLGPVQHISTLMTQRRSMLEVYQDALRKDARLNINHYLGSHYIHMTSFLLGATPLDVRATCQYGYAKEKLKLDTADTIQTHIRWLDRRGREFSSFHVAGWNDPKGTESMTFQQLHLVCQEGHIFSDQRYRGYRRISSGKGMEAPNPYFFNLEPSLLGNFDLRSKYGFKSILTFVELLEAGSSAWSHPALPTLDESENVTAILEAADISLDANSSVVEIKRRGSEYVLAIR